MAGAGYKLFNTGDVLTAAQVNTYLQEQVVMVFADATARTTALSSVLAEGMVSYLKDTNATEVYDGSAWVGIGNSGDITGVTAGTGISGGGTSGTVTITNAMATEITASGDIIVGTGSGTFDNLPIGTTGQVLTADTTVSPYKVKWASAAASDPAFCGTLVTNNATQSFPSGAYTTATFNTETYDSDAFHSTTTNTGRLTVPSGKAGYYYIFCWGNPDDSAAFEWIHTIDVNGTTIGRSRGYKTASAQASSTFVYTVRNLAVGDYVTTTIYQGSGANRTFNFGDTGVQGGFGMYRIGA